MIQKIAILGQGSMGSSITQHAANCGFENLSYFIRRFGRKYGMSPGQFRRGAARS